MSEPQTEPATRRWWIVAAAIALAAILAAVITVAVIRADNERPRPTPTLTTTSTGTPRPAPTETESPTPTPTVTTPAEAQPPTAEQRLHYEEAMTSGNTAALESDLADEVVVIYAASECCGALSPVDAITHLDYVLGDLTQTWNFSVDEATLAGYRAGFYAQYFPVDALVGISSTGAIATFVPGNDGQIVTIFLSLFSDI